MKTTPILITTCIQPSAPYTKLKDASQRLKYTVIGFRKLSKLAPDAQVVICDGSGYDFLEYKDELNRLFSKVEIISFCNNVEEVSLKGKGFGEGEIVEYALKHSELLLNSNSFIKLTGKLWVSNIREVLENYNDVAAFFPVLATYNKPIYIDTRFYIVSKCFYKEYLIDVHNKVNDRLKINLEDVFFESLRDKGFNVSDIFFSKFPVVYGCSGSTARRYHYGFFQLMKKKIKLYLYRMLNKNCMF